MALLVPLRKRLETYQQLSAALGGAFNVNPLLGPLHLAGVITIQEKSQILALTDPYDRISLLFMQTMPGKSEKCHRDLINVLRDELKNDDHASLLEQNLFKIPTENEKDAINVYSDFYNYLSGFNPPLLTKLTLPLFQIYGIINEEEKLYICKLDTSTDFIQALFLEIMPFKKEKIHEKLIAVFQNMRQCSQLEQPDQLGKRFPRGKTQTEVKSCSLLAQYLTTRLNQLKEYKEIERKSPKYTDTNTGTLPRGQEEMTQATETLYQAFSQATQYESMDVLDVSTETESSAHEFSSTLNHSRVNSVHVYTDTLDLSNETANSDDESTNNLPRVSEKGNSAFGFGERRKMSSIPPSGWSHTNEAYKLEFEALGSVPATTGELILKVKEKYKNPRDISHNEYYKNFTRPKGAALVISNKKYGNNMDRNGSKIDFSNIKQLLHRLDYQVFSGRDLSANEMLKHVKDFSALFSELRDPDKYYHSCIVVLLTLGIPGHFIGVDGQLLPQEIFFKTITGNKALAGKPKIFIVQACRGSNITKSIQMNYAYGPDRTAPTILSWIKLAESQAKKKFGSKIPAVADTCVLYSTTPAYFSWRDHERGSWFIQTICQEFSKHAHEPWADLMTLATRVANNVGKVFQHQQEIIQPPQVQSTMTKKFHFFPGAKNNFCIYM